ncbi:MAG: hypothetical protein D6780_03270, partial [Candidatus Dadabacteria bacterium]
MTQIILDVQSETLQDLQQAKAEPATVLRLRRWFRYDRDRKTNELKFFDAGLNDEEWKETARQALDLVNEGIKVPFSRRDEFILFAGFNYFRAQLIKQIQSNGFQEEVLKDDFKPSFSMLENFENMMRIRDFLIEQNMPLVT